MTPLYLVPDQPAPVIDPAQEVKEIRGRLDVFTATNPLLSPATRGAIEATVDLLRTVERGVG